MEWKYKLLRGFSLFMCVVSLLAVVLLAGIKVSYPIGYGNIIDSNCKKYDLEKSLVQAIIKVESGYNCMSLSSAQAMGLMQIMPTTAIWIADELNISDFKLEELYNPETNIEFGCFYLNYLFEKFKNEDKVLFAYNAGEKTLSEFCSPSLPLDIEKVEIEETKNYISRVQNAKKVYGIYEKIRNGLTN